MDTVGIIMATYNGMKYVEEQIESILGSTYANWKLWICDDGSKDGTIPILKKYEEQYPDKITVCQNKENLGVVRNFLEAVKNCDTEYMMFCDQDDVWKKNKIQITLEEMKRQEAAFHGPVIVFTDALVVDKNLHAIYPSFHQSSKLDTKKIDLSHLLMENKLIGCTMMFNSKVRGYLTKMPKSARVHDWWIALIGAGFGKVAYLNEPTLLYRQHGGNVIGNQNFRSYIQNRIMSLKKQRKALKETIEQASDFYAIYGAQLSKDKKQIVRDFALLHKKNWLLRRIVIVRRGFLKTGIIRNLGVLLLI